MFFKCLLLLLSLGLLEGFRAIGPKPPVRSRPSAMCAIPSLANGKVKLRQRGRLARFQCNPQYSLVGSRYTSCVNGRWDEQLPVCIRPGCQVMRIDNGLYVEHTNEAWVAYFCLPGHTLVGSQVVYCDGNKWNASAPTCVGKNQPVQLSCDFESAGLCGWVQDELHNFDWERRTRKTPSNFLFTGPSFDHTLGRGYEGHYMYIESSSKTVNDKARLISPVYGKELARNGCFSMYYHMYGVTCGGLRVYQKPDSMTMDSLLDLSDEDKKNYILFERWGNLGDIWLPSVSTLIEYDEDFQIIIEGIRGRSYTSDIAIDDVAILQGENCTQPEDPTTPAMPDSCYNRCDVSAPDEVCGCSTDCFDTHNCCPDYFDICIFLNDPFPGLKGSSEIPPNTQKLTNSSTIDGTELTTVKTSTTSTTTTTTPKPTTTTPKPTTTTPKPTTTTPKPTTTTTKPTTTTTKRTTTKATTTPKPTQKVTQRPPTQKPTTKNIITTKPPVKTTQKPTKVTFTTLTSTTTKITTTSPKTTTNKRQAHDEDVRKQRMEKTLELKGTVTDGRKAAKRGMSGWTVTFITFGVLMSVVGLVWFARASRSERGRLMLSRLRGRLTHDNEVRFLSANMEED